ncbi:MAG TPA: helix-turn-helix domain-containing protein [Ktedonobacterales bacterium]
MPGPIPMPFRPFGETLRYYRTLHGLSIEQTAAAAGISPAGISALESGVKGPPPPKQVVVRLADLFQLKGEDRDTFVEGGSWDAQFLGSFASVVNDKARKTLAKLGLVDGKEAQSPPPPAAILVFLIADVRGYTHFTQEAGDAEAARLAAKFAAIARGAVEERDGRLIELRGDEALAVFASARRAIDAAAVMQARFVEATRADPELPLPVGIGLDVGEAVPLEDGYRGAALNRAARLCSLAGAGEILITTGLAYLAPKVEGLAYLDRGSVALKGFDVPAALLAVAPADVEAEPAASAQAPQIEPPAE